MSADDKKSAEKSPEAGARPPPSQWRVLAMFIYIGVLVVLVKLYWPGWLSPSGAHPPPAPAAAVPTNGPQVPQN